MNNNFPKIIFPEISGSHQGQLSYITTNGRAHCTVREAIDSILRRFSHDWLRTRYETKRLCPYLPTRPGKGLLSSNHVASTARTYASNRPHWPRIFCSTLNKKSSGDNCVIFQLNTQIKPHSYPYSYNRSVCHISAKSHTWSYMFRTFNNTAAVYVLQQAY